MNIVVRWESYFTDYSKNKCKQKLKSYRCVLQLFQFFIEGFKFTFECCYTVAVFAKRDETEFE